MSSNTERAYCMICRREMMAESGHVCGGCSPLLQPAGPCPKCAAAQEALRKIASIKVDTSIPLEMRACESLGRAIGLASEAIAEGAE